MTSAPDTIHVRPPLEDDSGYAVRLSDLDFLGLTEQDIDEIHTNSVPLGMRAETYTEFVRTLLRAVEREGATDADIRLQGSSAHFFSGKHKTMPYEVEQTITEFSKNRKTMPSAMELRTIQQKLLGQWPEPQSRPLRRPFDSMHRIDLHTEPSDYDVQISSDMLVNTVLAEFVELGANPNQLHVDNPDYDFVEKVYVADCLLYLSLWCSRAEKLVGRPVTIALFGSAGPPVRNSIEDAQMSSHFQERDWIIMNVRD